MSNVLRVLFWNINKNSLLDEVRNLVEIHNINLLVIIEYGEHEELILKNLQSYNTDFRLIQNIIFNKAKIFTTLNNIEINEIYGHSRYGIYSLNIENFENLLMGIVHFPSKVNWGNSEDHSGLCTSLREDVELKEFEVEHQRTFVLGDFNMNPFENGLISANGLNNTNSKEIAYLGQRDILNKPFKYFYNPMWNFFGEFSKGNTCGTHYFDTYKYINLHWNIYDQVIIRPDLLDDFHESHLEILTEIDGKSLLKM
ncbi:hypothetical protein QWZ06_03135 [Chryseobacterium tructae]|uniref:hypothetical protein n=1 Tax=Chryseobacterium tructae TaxID=1037380 RepID=UPI0025B29EF0|nr:hypothetical protein [Chryseobacterium tructae]MDN3691326.1 hypothetical protein [Chryseobacterium tructae]